MAGIGFALRRLIHRDDLAGLVRAYSHAALVSSGPWLFTVAALAIIGIVAGSLSGDQTVDLFRIIVIYNFSFSLVISGPVVMVTTRYLADRIFLKQVDEAPGMLLGALSLTIALQALAAIPFYGLLPELTAAERLMALVNFFIIGGIWVATIFLSALKSYLAIAVTFGIGVLGALIATLALASPFGAAGMLGGFSVGLGIILFALIAQIFAEYPYRLVRPFGFLSYFRRYWELAFVGFFYNAAIWVDKWVMWFAPEHTVEARVLMSYPTYDGAMFMAYLSIVPAMAIFLVSVETRFFEEYLRFYRDVQGHATLRQIRENHRSIVAVLAESLRSVAVLQGATCYIAILLAPAILAFAFGGFSQLGIFRFGLLGALFHALFLFVMIVISYFDLRRVLLGVTAIFMVANGALTYMTLALGFPYYGYGYFLAALTALVSGYAMLVWKLRNLPYLTFIGNNPGLG